MHFDNMTALVLVVIGAITCTASATRYRRYQDDFSDPRQRLSTRIDSLTPLELLDLYDDLERFDDAGSYRRREVSKEPRDDKTSKQINTKTTFKAKESVSANQNKNKNKKSADTSNKNSKVSKTGISYATNKASSNARVSGKPNHANVKDVHGYKPVKKVAAPSNNKYSAKSQSSLIESALESAMDSLSEGPKQKHTLINKPFVGQAIVLQIKRSDPTVPLWKLKKRKRAFSNKLSDFCSKQLNQCRLMPVRDLKTLRGLVSNHVSNDDRFSALLNVAADSVKEEKYEKSGKARPEFQYGIVQKIDESELKTNTPAKSKSIRRSFVKAIRHLCSPEQVMCEVIAKSKINMKTPGKVPINKSTAGTSKPSITHTTSRPTSTHPSTTRKQPSHPNKTGHQVSHPAKPRPGNANNQMFIVVTRRNHVDRESSAQLMSRTILFKRQLKLMCGESLSMCNMVQLNSNKLPIKWNTVATQLPLISSLESVVHGEKFSVGSAANQSQAELMESHVPVPTTNPEYADKSVWIGICVGVGMSLLAILLLYGCYRCLLHYKSERQKKQIEKMLNRSRHEENNNPVHITMAKRGNNSNANHYVVSILNDKEREEDDWSSEEEVFNVSNPLDCSPKPKQTSTPTGTPKKTSNFLARHQR